MSKRTMVIIAVAVCLVTALFMCGNKNPSISDYEQSETGQSILAALKAAGIEDYTAIEIPEGETLKKLDEATPEAFYYSTLYYFKTNTESGKRLGIEVQEKRCVGIVDCDTEHYYYVGPSYYTETDGSVVEYYDKAVYSYETGEFLKSADREKANRASELYRQGLEQSSAESFREQMSKHGFSEEEADAMRETLKNVGVGSTTRGSVDGNMGVFQGTTNGHQVNVTTENNRVIYVQITGFKAQGVEWFVNWRGKLKYKTVDTETQFDLYDDVSGGYLAKYDTRTDSVIPWDEQ